MTEIDELGVSHMNKHPNVYLEATFFGRLAIAISFSYKYSNSVGQSP
jgi:hypothetical protein